MCPSPRGFLLFFSKENVSCEVAIMSCEQQEKPLEYKPLILPFLQTPGPGSDPPQLLIGGYVVG